MKDESEWDIFEKQTNKDKQKTGMLQQGHKEFIINLYDQNPQARVIGIVESLAKSFDDFSLKETGVRNFMKTEAICHSNEQHYVLVNETRKINFDCVLNG